MGNDPVKGVDKDGGFYEEFMNLINFGYFISNDGLAEMYSLWDKGITTDYEWIGNRLKGYGSLSWATYENGAPVINVNKYKATNDEIRTVNGKKYAVYPDLEASITIGLQGKFDFFKALDVNITVINYELFKYDFIENSLLVPWSAEDRKNLKFNTAFGIAVDEMGAEVAWRYDSKGVKFTATTIFGLDFTVTRDLMNKEAQTILGVGKSGGAAFIGGIESKFAVITEPIPNNDLNAWLKTKD